jgi:hypothetical protein
MILENEITLLIELNNLFEFIIFSLGFWTYA